jgi:hypothetical protein
MRVLGLLLVGLAFTASACGHKSDPNAPQVEQGGAVQSAARAWAVEIPDFARDLFDALAEHSALVTDMVGTWNTPQQVSPNEVATVRERFHELLLRAQALPGGTPEINEVNSTLVQALTLFEQAYDDYEAGLEQGRFKLLKEGDDLIARASAEVTKAQPSLEKVIGAPAEGTISAEAQKIAEAVRAANVELRKVLDANLAMLGALKRSDLDQAEKQANGGKRHADLALLRLESLPPSSYDELQDFQQDMIHGYQLVSSGFGSYAKGIPKLDLKVIRKGDEQTKTGLEDISEATQNLFTFLRSQ